MMRWFAGIMLMGLLVIQAKTFAQTKLNLRGEVVERDSGETLPLASVILLHDLEPARQIISDKKGLFSFGSLSEGSYRLITRYIGYRADTLKIRLRADTFVRVRLQTDYGNLAGVVIHGQASPFRVNKDTVTYNAGSFPTQANANVADLLKKLPGVQVDAEGNILVMGKRVDKILVDGKSISIGDLRSMTTLLPADFISNVQVFDSQTDEAKHTGISQNSDTRTINLNIKKADKNALVGNIYGGAAQGDSFAAGGQALKLGDQSFSANFNRNNINSLFSGTNDISGAFAPGKQTTDGINLNYHEDVSKKLSITAVVTGNGNYNTQASSNTSKTLLPDSSLFKSGSNSSAYSSRNYNVGADVTYQYDSLTYLNYHISASIGSRAGRSTDTSHVSVLKRGLAYPSSAEGTSTASTGQNNTWDQRLSVTHRFKKKGRTLMAEVGQDGGNDLSDQGLYTFLQTFQPAATKITNQRSDGRTGNQAFTGNFRYTEPVGDSLVVQVSAECSTRRGISEKSALDYDPLVRRYDLLDSLLSLNLANREMTGRYNAILMNQYNSRFHYELGLAFHSFSQYQTDYRNMSERKVAYESINPLATLRYNCGVGETLTAQYSSSNQNPSIDEIKPLPDISNPYLVRLGNPDLQKSLTQSLGLSMSDFNSATTRNIQLNLNGSYTTAPISMATTTLQGGVQQMQAVNVGSVYQINTNFNYGFPLFGQQHGTGNISTGVSYGTSRNLLNGDDNVSGNGGLNGALRLDYHLGKTLFIQNEANLSYLLSQSAVQGAAGQYILNNKLNVYCAPVDRVMFGANFQSQSNGVSKLPDQHTYLLNAFIERDLLKSRQLQLRLSGYNLLDNVASFQQSIYQNVISSSISDTQHRMLLVSLSYNYRKTNAGLN